MAFLWFPPAAGNPNCPFYWRLFTKTNGERFKGPHMCRGRGSTCNTAADNQAKVDFTHYGLALIIEPSQFFCQNMLNSKSSNSKTSEGQTDLQSVPERSDRFNHLP